MVSNLTILKNLVRINRLYSAASSPIETLLYAKIGIIELCGWVEESMDAIVIGVSQRSLTNQADRDYIEKQIVKKTYGFEYEAHFRRMLMGVIDLKGVVDMESRLNRAFF
jgi:hypothetical protein